MCLVNFFRSGLKRKGTHTREAALDRESPSLARRNAVYRLKDQSTLAKIAQDDTEWTVRNAAVWMLTDQLLLASIAEKDVHPYVRQAARLKLGLDLED